jgi:hypothetical protein
MELWVVCDNDGYVAGVFTTLEKAKAEAENWNEEGYDARWETYPSPNFLDYRMGDDYYMALRKVTVDIPTVPTVGTESA